MFIDHKLDWYDGKFGFVYWIDYLKLTKLGGIFKWFSIFQPVPHVKVEEEAAVTNGKEAAVEKKSKTPLRENKMKAAKKNESEVKTPHGDDSKKAESLPAAEEVRPPPKRRGRKPKALLESEE